MAAAIREALPAAEIELVPDGAGVFTVIAGGVEYWNKHQKGGFPNQDEFVRFLAFKLNQANPPKS